MKYGREPRATKIANAYTRFRCSIKIIVECKISCEFARSAIAIPKSGDHARERPNADIVNRLLMPTSSPSFSVSFSVILSVHFWSLSGFWLFGSFSYAVFFLSLLLSVPLSLCFFFRLFHSLFFSFSY